MPVGPDQLIANALAAFHDRIARGEAVDPDSFCRGFGQRHPELEAELRAQIAALEFTKGTASGAAPAAVSSTEDLPERLSGCQILGEIGSGGMGRVLLAHDPGLRRKVAIKTLASRYLGDQRLRARFMEEARAMARLSHPNIVRIYHLGSADEPPHFVMEYLEGAPLTEAARPLSMRQKAELMHKVVLAVDFLHRNEMVHRDLKPANILVDPNLEPKLLDFGLARQLDDAGLRLTREGEVMGTPHYFSPEQARAQAPLDARSDVFSLGTVLYEVLTGVLPFRGADLADQVRQTCERDPALPRRLNPAVPGELQNICLKALEKEPPHRYQSALEMAQDLERYLAGESVLALPRMYSQMLSGQIEQHLKDVEAWRQDRVLTPFEYDALRRAYDRLFEREDAWIMEFRRLSLSQVSLYLGAWLLAVGAALVVLFRYELLGGTPSVLLIGAATGPAVHIGIRTWKQGRLRIAVAFLLAFCLLAPLLLLVAMHAYGWFTAHTQDREDLELFSLFESFRRTTNSQLWWSLLLALPAYLWLRRFTGSSVFSLVFATAGALLALATILRLGAIEWLDRDPGRLYLHLLPAAAAFFTAGLTLEIRGRPADSRYFYPFAVIFTMVALTGVVTFHEPYRQWLEKAAPWTRGQLEYLFLINAGVYAGLQQVSERFSMPQMRNVAKAFRFVIPGHVLTSLLFLGLGATARWRESPAEGALRLEARLFEFLLPAAALVFVFRSIPRQMKNYLATGLLFLAVGIVRLQQNLLRDRAEWPIFLLFIGLLLMLAAANYRRLKAGL